MAIKMQNRILTQLHEKSIIQYGNLCGNIIVLLFSLLSINDISLKF